MTRNKMQCRPNCGACCIAPSITSTLPNMPKGKPAGVFCTNLSSSNFQCKIWEQGDYPKVCRDFKACDDVCGDNREEALRLITWFERATNP